MQTLVVFELNTIISLLLNSLWPSRDNAWRRQTTIWTNVYLSSVRSEGNFMRGNSAIYRNHLSESYFFFFNFPDVHCTHKVIHIGCALLLCFDGSKFQSIVSTFSRVTSLASQWRHIVCLTVYFDADQRKQQSSAPLAIVRRIQRWPVNSLHKRTVARKCFNLMTLPCEI